MSAEIEIPLLEELAAQEHASWANWAQYELDTLEKQVDHKTSAEDMFDAEDFRNLPGVQRWRRQIKTPYAELSEREKESDRGIVRKKYDLYRKAALEIE